MRRRPQLRSSPKFDELVQEVVRRFRVTVGENIKLGGMYSFSIPPVVTCPGKTKVCRKACYARMMYARRPVVRWSWDRSRDITKHPMFRALLTVALGRLKPGIVRWHVSGDFYSPRYMEDVIEAFKANPHLHPFTFTRSWRQPRFRAVLARYDWPKWILASTDSETGPPPPMMREAKMSDQRLYGTRLGRYPYPVGLCDEQRDPSRTCDKCGRCPLVRVSKGALTMLPSVAARKGVIFLTH